MITKPSFCIFLYFFQNQTHLFLVLFILQNFQIHMIHFIFLEIFFNIILILGTNFIVVCKVKKFSKYETPQWQILSLYKIGKKVLFLQQAAMSPMLWNIDDNAELIRAAALWYCYNHFCSSLPARRCRLNPFIRKLLT